MASIIPKDLGVLLGPANNPGCYHQKYDGTTDTSTDKDCVQNWSNPDKEDHRPMHFVCAKSSSCEKIPDCTELSSAPGSCFMKFDDNGLFQDAVDKCNGAKGLMPRATVLATTIEMLSTLSY